MVKNAYIHIPFCRQKCNYCSFVSFPDIEYKSDYINALIREIKYFYREENLDTIYFGGGTPTTLSIDEFTQILNILNFNSSSELTVEVNPETVTKNYLSELKQLGINRLSFGCQTFDKNILKVIGRKHSPEQVIDCIAFAQETGFKNISLDFIYGLPGQSISGFVSDLQEIKKLGIQHISLYGLKIEEGCSFYINKPKNLPDTDIQADMYIQAISTLTDIGLFHYEISNFAHPGFESRHNLNYWNNNSYYGFGLSAHGYTGKIRYNNTTSLKIYIENPTLHAGEISLTPQEQLEEEIFLGFRKTSGIDIEQINQKYNINFENKYKDILKKYITSGHLERASQKYKLTDKGILVSNVILADFLE